MALATYLVFFASSSVALFAVVAATTADAELAEAVKGADAAAAASLYEPAVDVGFDLLIVTGVQSWQSGACVSVVLYLFR